MTREEIKQRYSMREIVERYGLRPNRAGFVKCPFHKGDNTASMKVYKESYHCFGCNENGDIFSFIMKMDNLTFKEVFLSLGGTYADDSFESKLAQYRSQQRQIMRNKAEEKLKRHRELNNTLIDIYREYMKRSEPFSEVWCDCCNALQYQLYLHEILNEKRAEI